MTLTFFKVLCSEDVDDMKLVVTTELSRIPKESLHEDVEKKAGKSALRLQGVLLEVENLYNPIFVARTTTICE